MDAAGARTAVAEALGIPERFVTDYLLAELPNRPELADHVDACRDDPDMLALVVRLDRPQPAHGPLEALGDVLARLATGRPVAVNAAAYAARVEICMRCEHLTTRLGAHSCGLCGCVVELKARLAGETCPDRAAGPGGRWP